ncbi:MAG: arginase family protein [Thermoplasmata archaeon]|nr:arginase family protein [Thermoplasmata archaeon]
MDPILLGVPWDGTTLGRKGARLAPGAIREELRQRLHPYDAASGHMVRWGDAGDATVGATHDEMLDGVSNAVAEQWKAGERPVIGLLGGDHAVAYAGIRAVRPFFPELMVLSLDSHLDLRPRDQGPSNGNWALRMIEDFRRPLVEIGRGRFSNDEGLFETARKSGVHVVPASELRRRGVSRAVEPVEAVTESGRDVYLSIDIDVVHQAAAPGATAPSVDGIAVDDLLDLLEWASRRFRVRAFDICEVNPPVDPTSVTARLAGYAALSLLSRYAPSSVDVAPARSGERI